MILKEQSSSILAAGGAWSTAWLDNGLSVAELMASISVATDQPGQFIIYQTDNPSQPLMTLPGYAVPVPGGTPVVVAQLPLMHLFWSVVYQNGATAQTRFDIVVSASASERSGILLELKQINFQLRKLNDPRIGIEDSVNQLTEPF